MTYDDWKLQGPPEADEQRIDFSCEKEDDEGNLCTFDGETIAFICGDRMTYQCPVCDWDYEDSARDWFSHE